MVSVEEAELTVEAQESQRGTGRSKRDQSPGSQKWLQKTVLSDVTKYPRKAHVCQNRQESYLEAFLMK